MKSYLFIFLFLLLFSFPSWSFEIGICEKADGTSCDTSKDNCPPGDLTYSAGYIPTCSYNGFTGESICSLKDIPGIGVYDQKTGLCSNFVNPHLNSSGELDCPTTKRSKN